MVETVPQTTAVSMLSDILIFGLVVAVLFLALTFGHMLCHYIPRRSSNRDNEVRSQPPSASARRSASWFWPGSEQRSRDNGDVEAGDSHTFNTSEGQTRPLIDLHGAWPGAAPPQFASISQTPLLGPASSAFDSNPANLPVASYRDGASPGFDTLHTFGKSGEGEVSVVKQNSTGKLLVIKTVRMKKRQTATGYKTPAEAEMLTIHLSGKHPNIIVCHEFEIEERPESPWLCHMLLECCSGGDLADFCAHWHMLRDLQGQHVPELFLMHFINSMADALGYLHLGNLVIHRDIKPANLFLRCSGPQTYGMGPIVLSDFGFACFEAESVGVCGTPGYMPPEAQAVWDLADTDSVAFRATRDQQCMTSASDIYTFGATLHDLVFLDGFDNKRQSYTPDDLATAFADGPYTQSPWLLEILNRTLAEDPKARMTTSELVHVAARIKDAMVSLVEAGVRMPPNSWPPTLIADNSSAAASAESPEYISSERQVSDFPLPGVIFAMPVSESQAFQFPPTWAGLRKESEWETASGHPAAPIWKPKPPGFWGWGFMVRSKAGHAVSMVLSLGMLRSWVWQALPQYRTCLQRVQRRRGPPLASELAPQMLQTWSTVGKLAAVPMALGVRCGSPGQGLGALFVTKAGGLFVLKGAPPELREISPLYSCSLPGLAR
ncbi:hypothetical protein B0A55_11202 [Friedmanniomyces simplex]|uniref:non-specific serine/threonine protein kinase n=1 Tax=Friedmanniomyces simplex TaxID=329884 RepID=A0A4U0WEK2_9PEZI|nr:hypothetical protein B0A55_11202 [Friedmanniomyces simplex]